MPALSIWAYFKNFHWAPFPSTLCLSEMMHMTRSPRTLPFVLPYCRRSQIGSDEGMEMSLPSECSHVPQKLLNGLVPPWAWWKVVAFQLLVLLVACHGTCMRRVGNMNTPHISNCELLTINHKHFRYWGWLLALACSSYIHGLPCKYNFSALSSCSCLLFLLHIWYLLSLTSCSHWT